MGRAERTNAFNQWKKTESVSPHDCYDQYGRQIGVGDFLITQAHPTVVWRVTGTRPILRPDVPPGVVEITLAAVTQVGMQGGAPLPGIIKVRDAMEYMTPEQIEAHKADTRQGEGGESSPVVPITQDTAHEPPPSPSGDEPSRIILP